MDDHSIERVGRDVARLDLADHILSWDRKQAREGLLGDFPVRVCANDPAHGKLQMHASGSQLLCCVTRPTPCTYAEPVSR